MRDQKNYWGEFFSPNVSEEALNAFESAVTFWGYYKKTFELYKNLKTDPNFEKISDTNPDPYSALLLFDIDQYKRMKDEKKSRPERAILLMGTAVRYSEMYGEKIQLALKLGHPQAGRFMFEHQTDMMYFLQEWFVDSAQYYRK